MLNQYDFIFDMKYWLHNYGVTPELCIFAVAHNPQGTHVYGWPQATTMENRSSYCPYFGHAATLYGK